MKTSDTDLIRRVLDGDQDAFTTLVNRYRKRVHTLVWRKIGDFHVAEEITQDVFLKAYKKLSMLKPPYHFSGWLYVIASRRCIAWLRKKQSPTVSLDAMPAVQLEEVSYTQYETARGEAASVEHQRDLVKRLLEKLPESERTVITMHYVSELSCKEISEFLGVSPNTIKSRLHRARERLKNQEHLLHDVSSIFQLPPTLTENIMREVARIKPTSPAVSKPPWLPLGLSFASALMIILMMGFARSALFRFQQPYSLDAVSEVTIEIIEAPIVLPLKLKPDVRTQQGNTNTVGRSSSAGSKVDAQLLSATSDAEVLEAEPQWAQTKELTGGEVRNLFLTSEKELYAVGSAGLYRLDDDNRAGWILINASLPLTHQSEPMAEWNGTLYIATQTELFASTDRGATWGSVGSRPQGSAIALLITGSTQLRQPPDVEIEMYLVLTNGVFRSLDAGNTWYAFDDGLNQPKIQDAAAVGNVLFLGTMQGLYRLNSGVWEKLTVAQSQSIDSLAVANNRIYFNAKSQQDQRSKSFFTSDDFGKSWIDITPPNLDRRTSPLTAGFVKLVAAGGTVFVLGVGVLRSTDAGSTWEHLGFDKHGFILRAFPAVALDEKIVFVTGTSDIKRSTDGGTTWHAFMRGITELHVLNLAQVNNVLYATTDKGIAKSTDGGELWTYLGTESPHSLGESFGAMRLSNITAIDNSLYVRAAQGGNTNYFFHLPGGGNTLLPIKDMPVYVDLNRSEGLENITYIASTSNLNETDQEGLSDYQFGISGATTKTTGDFAVSGDTFYIESDRRLYRWTLGDPKWKDIDAQDVPVFSDFYATNGFQFAVSGEIVYLGKSNGQLCQSLDGGDTWRDVTQDLPFPLNKAESQDQILKHLPYFKKIVFAGSTVYVATSDGVVMSNDSENWYLLTDSEDTPITMEQLTVDGTTLYGISQSGVYRLHSDTDIWMQITSEVPEHVTSLVVAEDILYIGTENRGLLRLPLHNL